MFKLELEHHFDAAHKLEKYEGACANIHGHRWVVKVKIIGDKLGDNGILVDFKLIKKIINQLDHCYLNDTVRFNPTAENIAKRLYEIIGEYCDTLAHEPRIDSVEVLESPGASIIYE